MSTARNSVTCRVSVVLTCGLLAACAAPPRPANDFVWDPHEAENRETHALNKEIDKAAFKGADGGQPGPVAQGVANVGHNLGLPRMVVNNVLQLRAEPAARNTLRFAINTTLGVAGIFDPAGRWFGLTEDYTDFGETLHVWGVGEGAYMELPLAGPSTERDVLGKIVDIAMDPVSLALSGTDQLVASGFRLGAKSVDRKRYATTVDSVLYDSADSYAQSRLMYLQNRRHQLYGEEMNDADIIDPYAD